VKLFGNKYEFYLLHCNCNLFSSRFLQLTKTFPNLDITNPAVGIGKVFADLLMRENNMFVEKKSVTSFELYTTCGTLIKTISGESRG